MGSKRRIDDLLCTSKSAEESIKKILTDLQQRRTHVSNEVRACIAQRIEALNQRQQDLLAHIDQLAQEKTQALQSQLREIQAGVCPASAADPSAFFLRADSIIGFKIGDDILDKIGVLGVITEVSTYASESYAQGPALGTLKVGNPSNLFVHACDKDGFRRSEGGDRVVVSTDAPDDFENVVVEDLQDGRYKVSLQPKTAGSYHLWASIGSEGQEELIGGAPFDLVVRTPTQYHLLGERNGDGPQPTIGSMPDPTGKFGTFGHPSGVAFDATGRFLFVADQSNHRIQAFDTQEDNAPVCCFGRKGVGPWDFDSPCGIVANRENHVMVSDLLNHRVQVLDFSPQSRTFRWLSSLEHNFSFPKGLALNECGHLLVCDSGNHRIQQFDVAASFQFVREFGAYGVGDGALVTPLAAAVNRSGEVLVSDSNNHISVFDSSGNFLRVVGSKGKSDGRFNYPVGLCVDDEDALFVCDQGNRRMQVLKASSGAFLHKWGAAKQTQEPPAEEAPADEDGEPVAQESAPTLQRPSAVAINSNGCVVVADYTNNLLWLY